MNKIKYLILLLIVNFSYAQQTTAKLNPVPVKDFYKVIVASEIRSASNHDFSDLRIYNNENKEIPYSLEFDVQEKMIEKLESLNILSKSTIAKKNTSIIIENPKSKINELTLQITNSDVIKKYTISGSNDQKQWFGLVNNNLLTDLKTDNSTSVTKTISFPLCSYHFIKIDLDDTKTLPINILSVGTIENEFSKGNFQELKPLNTQITQIQNKKKTLIKIVFEYPQDIDKIVFDIKNPTLYNRSSRVFSINTKKVKNKLKLIENEISNFTISSDKNNNFDINCSKQKEIFIEIENQDNPELEISNIKFFQKPIYLITQLSPNEEYTVKTGNPNLTAPIYDLNFFKEEMENVKTTIGMSNIQHFINSKSTITPKPFWQKTWFMWLCIAIGGITILFFTNSLMNDMKNKS